MKKLLLIICLFFTSHLFANPQQEWTRVSCSNLNHTEIYDRIKSFVDYFGADIAYDDGGYRLKALIEVESTNCYEVVHILDVIIYDGSFSYFLDQSISFENDMAACFTEVRKQVGAIEEILKKLPTL